MLCAAVPHRCLYICLSRFCVMISCCALFGKVMRDKIPQVRRPLHDVDSAVPGCRSRLLALLMIPYIVVAARSRYPVGGPLRSARGCGISPIVGYSQ